MAADNAIFLCNCGGTLKERIDFGRLERHIMEHASDYSLNSHSTLCSREGLEFLKATLAERKPGHVIIAGCATQDVDESIRRQVEAQGMNPSMFLIRGIREGAAWISEERQAATEIAMTVIDSAVRRLRQSKPLERGSRPVLTDVLVLGAGAAGLAASLSLAGMNHRVYMLEQESALGSGKSNGALTSLMERVKKTEKIEVYTDARIADFEGQIGRFQAIVDMKGERKTLSFGGLIVAVGNTYAPSYEEYGLSRSAAIMGFRDFKERLSQKTLPGKSLGFLLDEESEFSFLPCSVVMKEALTLREAGFEICIFYKNIKVATDDLEKIYGELRDLGALFIRYEGRPQFTSRDDGRIAVTFTDSLSTLECIPIKAEFLYDGFVFPERVNPPSDNHRLSRMLRIKVDRRGFLQEEKVFLQPLSSNRPGIFLAGGCKGPVDEDSAIEEGTAAAGELHSLLQECGKERYLDESKVDQDKCVLCLTCYRSCPHGAIDVEYEDSPTFKAGIGTKADFIACQRCGVCASVCPVKAIQLPRYSDNEIIAELGFI